MAEINPPNGYARDLIAAVHPHIPWHTRFSPNPFFFPGHHGLNTAAREPTMEDAMAEHVSRRKLDSPIQKSDMQRRMLQITWIGCSATIGYRGACPRCERNPQRSTNSGVKLPRAPNSTSPTDATVDHHEHC